MSDIAGLLDRAWSIIETGLADPGHPCHTPGLATVGADGGAEARIVVLRRADRDAGELDVHSDTAADKVAELADHPQATLLFWDTSTSVQIRARIETRVLSGPELDPTWADLSQDARKKYGNTPPPGTGIDAPERHEPTIDRARFGVLSGRIRSIDVLDIGDTLPLRATYDRADGFAGTWLAP